MWQSVACCAAVQTLENLTVSSRERRNMCVCSSYSNCVIVVGVFATLPESYGTWYHVAMAQRIMGRRNGRQVIVFRC